MTDVLLAFGRGLVKVVISATTGVGVGLVTIGYFSMQRSSELNFNYDPPLGDTLFSVGAGLLAAALLMVVQFYGPWAYRNYVADPTRYPDAPAQLRDSV